MRRVVLILAGLMMVLGVSAQVNVISMDVMRARHAVDTLVQNDQYLESGGAINYTDSTAVLDTIFIGSSKIYYSAADRTTSRATGISDVVVQDGQELYNLVINRTGSILYNGTPVYVLGVDATTGLFSVDSAKASSLAGSLGFNGLVTADLPDDSIGLVTTFGMVRDFDTDHLVTTPTTGGYLGADGGITSTKPLYPNYIVIIGATQISDPAVGRFHVNPFQVIRERADRSYNFTSRGITAGTYWRGGFYDFVATDANLDEGSLTITLGSANHPYSAHPFIVAGGAGTVDAGTVGLRVTGTSITDAAVRTTSDADTITTDITTLSADDYLEAKKFIGTVTYELIETGGSPTTYSLDFNYGYAKYEDYGNVDFTIVGIEAVGLAGATDTDYDMTLFHHNELGWTYAATGFVAGGTVICDWSTDMVTEDDLTSGQDYAWKRSNLDTFIDGSDSEGIIIKIVAGQNNSVQTMDIHITGLVESF